ncbi:TonB-dependent receptor [Asticcacaulis sp. AC402]|uniref:TonB-dependent receptor n=1 Tax=Asticcacaulis sp. AC402 TaxID=1282361 RepID=UPI0003C3B35D|nr:TonB-dependent receptor [Asticcacaulis sp. AC402]ESQ77460.1 hypothetical protein ABAC402_01270 [Asticcacaulis sp. AC402]
MRISKGKALTGLVLKGGVSALALTAFAAVAATPAMAQDAPAQGEAAGAQEVVVVGVRRSLKTAQQIKKDADTVVDSITANDIGSFPDKSVAEALQRVAGITVNRFAATGDTAHFSAEPSGVVVRGLQQVRSEFNGRDIFTADSSRGLSWSDVSPELMGGVDVYKNQTAELIEGGIAGTINLRTRLPFDSKGRVLAATAEYTYGDLVKKGASSISGIYADRWETSAGEFGFMVNAAHSGIYTNSEGIAFGRMVPYANAGTWGTSAKRWLPMTVALRDNVYDRVRTGIALAGQWQNNDKTMLATLQYNQSKKTEQWEEYVATSSTGADAWAQPINYVNTGDGVQCLANTTCTFDGDGYFQSGTLVNGNGQWYGSFQNPTGSTSPNGLARTCYSWEANASCPASQKATAYSNDTRWSDTTNNTQDISFNFKWSPTDRLKLNFDVQRIDATQENYDISTQLSTWATTKLDFTGDHPTMEVANNAVGWFLAPGAGGTAQITNKNNYRVPWIMDHVTDSEGESFATRADLAYSFDSPWLNTLKAGVRFAEREQTVRWTTYNWQAVVNNWSNYTADNFYITGSKFPSQDAYADYTFDSNFYGGGVTNVSTAPFIKTSVLQDREGFAAAFGNTAYKPQYTDGTNSNAWVPICNRSGETDGCFRPAEVALVSEKTKAAYVQLKFGGPDATIFNGVTVTGNIGLRYVETTNESTGGVNYSSGMTYGATPLSETAPGSGIFRPSVTYYVAGLVGTPPAVTANPTTDPTTYAAQVAAATAYANNPANFTQDRAFLLPNSGLETATITHKNWLPSFNVRLGLTDQWFLRFAASKAMSRPDIGNLKKYTSVGMSLPPASATLDCNPTTGAFECNSSGAIVKTKTRFTGSANNPYLKSVTADQFDLSVENYFSSTGSFTFNLFYKKFHDYIQYGKYTTSFTNNGVTRDVEISGPVNGEGASIKGFEITYQTFFDDLPAPFNGFGIQTNWTHLSNSGIKNSGVVVNSGDGSSGAAGGGTSTAALSFSDLPLEGLSDDTFNLIGMYEKGPLSARLAYNWRSQYMVTAQDCCVAFPIWQDAAGYLDGRVAYRFNDNVEVSLEGTNLLSTETVLKQQVDGNMTNGYEAERLLLPNAWFKNDRRIQASVRLKY